MEDSVAVVRPLDLKWRVIGTVARAAIRLGFSRSEVVMDLAHDHGSTPLAVAAQKGNVKVVRWLLNNGALKSVHLKTKNGRSPLDLSRIFGPHREVTLRVQSAFFESLDPHLPLLVGRLSASSARSCWTTSLRQSSRNRRGGRCLTCLQVKILTLQTPKTTTA